MRSLICTLFTFLLVMPFVAGAESLDPLVVEDAVLLPSGQLEVVLGGRGRFGGTTLFDSDDRDEWSAPILSVRAGLGSRAEVQASWEALYAEFPDQERNSKYGTGDARLFTKVRIFSQGDVLSSYFPATAVHFGLKIPNASRRSMLGTDEPDLFGKFLFSEDFSSGWRAIVNAGIGILGNPGNLRGQDDVLLWNAAIITPEVRNWSAATMRFYLETEGSGGGRSATERRRVVGGARLSWGKLDLFFGGGTGLSSASEDVIARFGFVYHPERFF